MTGKALTSRAQNLTARLAALINGVDGWHSFGAPATGWRVGGIARYKAIGVSGLIMVEIGDLVPPGTNPADNSAVWTSGTGLPAGYCPAVNSPRLPCYSSGGALGTELAALKFLTTGEIDVIGISGTSINRLDGIFILSTV